jgi:hypothetical protein
MVPVSAGNRVMDLVIFMFVPFSLISIPLNIEKPTENFKLGSNQPARF